LPFAVRSLLCRYRSQSPLGAPPVSITVRFSPRIHSRLPNAQLPSIKNVNALTAISTILLNLCTSTLTLVFTAAPIWDLLANRRSAWRLDGGTAFFGVGSCALAVVSTALAFMCISHRHACQWLPDLVLAGKRPPPPADAPLATPPLSPADGVSRASARDPGASPPVVINPPSRRRRRRSLDETAATASTVTTPPAPASALLALSALPALSALAFATMLACAGTVGTSASAGTSSAGAGRLIRDLTARAPDRRTCTGARTRCAPSRGAPAGCACVRADARIAGRVGFSRRAGHSRRRARGLILPLCVSLATLASIVGPALPVRAQRFWAATRAAELCARPHKRLALAPLPAGDAAARRSWSSPGWRSPPAPPSSARRTSASRSRRFLRPTPLRAYPWRSVRTLTPAAARRRRRCI
jgi:hypothetical protein